MTAIVPVDVEVKTLSVVQNTSAASMLARIESVCGPLPMSMLLQGANTHRFYSRSRQIYERVDGCVCTLNPKRTSLAALIPSADPGFIDFLSSLLVPCPSARASAELALQHPWLQERCVSVDATHLKNMTASWDASLL